MPFINMVVSALTKIISFFDQHQWLIALLAGLVAVFIYYKGRSDNKKDAAKLILQEIRYADQKVRNYRTYDSYNFTEKILPTNSWHRNINLFIRELTESELDLISKFFSSATYLDEIIKSIAESKNSRFIQVEAPAVVGDTPVAVAMGTGGLSANDPSKKLIEAISRDIESIYNTPAADKLRKISDKKFLLFF
ncbi:MAG: hypothetical protein G01um10143_207 [Parcubacteria group bacterium Gr01-1014_3]|nr:MAG: hypothetical protein G01um10143_207 [Parcubacteria group bacterium Gr01-1014_3]